MAGIFEPLEIKLEILIGAVAFSWRCSLTKLEFNCSALLLPKTP